MRILRHITANHQKLISFPFPRELSMESYLVENSSILALGHDANDDFSEVSIVCEELTLKEGRGLGDGRIDLLISYGNNYAGVVELKKGEINETHLTQLEDYLSPSNKNQLLQQFPEEDRTKMRWIGILVGTSIENELQQKISDGILIGGDIPVAALTLDRFKSDKEIFVATDVFFRINGKDWTKYLFKGEKFGKGKLVLEVVQNYVSENPNTKFSELKRVFPDQLQGAGLGVFDTLEKAEEIFDRWKYKRYFTNPDQIITLVDETKIAVCSQWGKGNIDPLISHAQKVLKYSIRKLTL